MQVAASSGRVSQWATAAGLSLISVIGKVAQRRTRQQLAGEIIDREPDTDSAEHGIEFLQRGLVIGDVFFADIENPVGLAAGLGRP